MNLMKPLLRVTASALRLTAKAVLNWPWVVALICVISPISPHVRIPYELSYTYCDYIGTRGVVEKSDTSDCPLITIINTHNGESVSW